MKGINCGTLKNKANQNPLDDYVDAIYFARIGGYVTAIRILNKFLATTSKRLDGMEANAWFTIGLCYEGISKRTNDRRYLITANRYMEFALDSFNRDGIDPIIAQEYKNFLERHPCLDLLVNTNP